MCASSAGYLEIAATEYETAKSYLESAKSNFESACGHFGFSKGDEYACGQFGYVREKYRNAADELENAANHLKSTTSDVGSFCGVPDETSKYMRGLVKAMKENEELRKRVLQLEQEIERNRQGSRSTEESPSLAK